MKIYTKYFVALILSFFFAHAIAQKNESLAALKALEIIDLFKLDQFEKAYTFCDEVMLRKITPERFQSIWESLAAVNGDLNEIGATRYNYLDSFHVTTTKLKFKNMNLQNQKSMI